MATLALTSPSHPHRNAEPDAPPTLADIAAEILVKVAEQDGSPAEAIARFRAYGQPYMDELADAVQALTAPAVAAVPS